MGHKASWCLNFEILQVSSTICRFMRAGHTNWRAPSDTLPERFGLESLTAEAPKNGQHDD